MEKKTIVLTLLGIFLFTLGCRLYFGFSTDYFNDDTSYFNLRQAEHIKETGYPLYNDLLSYGGRTLRFLPFFHYLTAFLSMVFPQIFAIHFFPNLFASLLVFAAYLIIDHLTNNKEAALFTAFLAGFIPIYFVETVNSLSIYSITIPLTLLLCYCLFKIEQKKYTYYFLILLCILLFSHPSIIVLLVAFILYLLFLKIEKMPVKRAETEVILFSLFFTIWLFIIIFKNAFLVHGYSIVWQNMPKEILSRYFHQIGILDAIYQIGILPFIFGIYLVYSYMFNIKNRYIYLLISFVISITLFLWLKLIELKMALIYLGVILVLLFGQFYHLFMEYFNKTRIASYRKYIVALFILVFVVSSLIPSLTIANSRLKNSYIKEEASALKFLDSITGKDAVILGAVDEGHLITYFSKRKNVEDSNFLMISEIDERTSDINTLYTVRSTTLAVILLNKYNVDYIIFTPHAKKYYNEEKLYYLDPKCFDEVYLSKNTNVYEVKCK